MLRRTAQVAARIDMADFVVATDHSDIMEHCRAYSLPAVMTDENLTSGSDRALVAAKAIKSKADVIVNLQGDAPFTDPTHVEAVIQRLVEETVDIATPAITLSWDALDHLREAKKATPFSGTTVIENSGRAVWFSKNIIPAVRDEGRLRRTETLSPVLRHVGLYGFRRNALERFTQLPQSPYEKLEGLEQLRALENGMSIAIVKVAPPQISSPGIDTEADLIRAEALIRTHGDPFKS